MADLKLKKETVEALNALGATEVKASPYSLFNQVMVQYKYKNDEKTHAYIASGSKEADGSKTDGVTHYGTITKEGPFGRFHPGHIAPSHVSKVHDILMKDEAYKAIIDAGKRGAAPEDSETKIAAASPRPSTTLSI